MTPRSKSSAVKYHWFCEHLMKGVVKIKPIGTAEQAADIFTKVTLQPIFEYPREKLLGW
jgi:hypothetical protein